MSQLPGSGLMVCQCGDELHRKFLYRINLLMHLGNSYKNGWEGAGPRDTRYVPVAEDTMHFRPRNQRPLSYN